MNKKNPTVICQAIKTGDCKKPETMLCIHAKPHNALTFCCTHQDCDYVPRDSWVKCVDCNIKNQ